MHASVELRWLKILDYKLVKFNPLEKYEIVLKFTRYFMRLLMHTYWIIITPKIIFGVVFGVEEVCFVRFFSLTLEHTWLLQLVCWNLSFISSLISLISYSN